MGKFAPLHRGHQHLIDAARDRCRHLTVWVWSNPDFPAMPVEIRAGWLRACYPGVEVRAFAPAQAPPDDAPAEAHHAFVRDRLRTRVDAVFTSETYGPAFAEALGAEHVAVDPGRTVMPVSGSRIRADVHAHRDWLDPRVYAHFVCKVVFLGAESTGKSTLARCLAERLETAYVPEYGRTLWEEQEGHLSVDDFARIAETHRAAEEEALREAHRYLFVDTNALTTQLYAFFYHGQCPVAVQELAASCRERYDHTFVCAPDFPFEQDGTRVLPQVQRYQDGAVRHDLTVRGIPYRVLHGPVDVRVEAVCELLEAANEGGGW